MIPFFTTFIVFEIFKKWRKVSFDNKKQWNVWLKRSIRDIVLWLAVFILVYIIFWPAMWVNPIGMIAKQIIAPFKFVDTSEEVVRVIVTNTIVNYQPIIEKIIERATYYPKWYLWQSTPIELIGVFLALVLLPLKVAFFKSPTNRIIAILLAWFAFLYIVFVSFISKSNPRYMIPAFVVLDLIAAYGWMALLGLILQFRLRWVRYSTFTFIFLSIMVIQIGGVALIYPYFYSYYNPLMGGGKKAGETLFVGSGEGLDEAGRYLSQKPDASKLTAMSWYGSGSFSYYFSGTTIIIPTGISDNEYIAKNIVSADYLVVYTSQWYRRIPPQLFNILDQIVPEHSIWINGIEYARIYAVDELPQEVFQY